MFKGIYEYGSLNNSGKKIILYKLSIIYNKNINSRAQRAAKEAKETPAQPAPEKARIDVRKFVKIGRPGYKVTKQRDPESGQQSLLYQVSVRFL